MDIEAIDFTVPSVREFVRLLPGAIAVLDTEMRYLAVSGRWLSDYGLAQRDILGLSHYEVFPEISERWKVLHQRGLQGERLSCHEEPFPRADGRTDWVRWDLVPWKDESGTIRGLILYTEVITGQKLRELELEESRETLRTIIDSSPAAITLKDPEGRYLLVNRTFATWMCCEHSDLIGQLEADSQSADRDRQVLAGGGPQVVEVNRAFPDGKTRSALVHKAPVTASGGEIVAVSTIAVDNTERRLLEEQLLRSQRLEAVGKLTGGIAHDFNNLMQIMMGNAEILQGLVGAQDAEGEEGEEGAAARRVESILSALNRASSLTGRLLAFSRQQVLSPETVDLAALVAELHDMLHRSLGETVELTTAFGPDLWPAEIDAYQFENALVNLAINARDAMPDGGSVLIEAANVTLDEAFARQAGELVPGDYVRISVGDTGYGIEPELLHQVFEPFFTTKDVGKGSGLGLSMVYGFAKQSDGHITIRSQPGEGTTVDLYLPRSSAAAPDRQSAGDEVPEPKRGGERVLLVEDNVELRLVPAGFLRDQGYEVVEAGNGREALERLREDPPFDLLFTDVVLPGGMTGVDLAETARELQPGIKVLYTTGYAASALPHGHNPDDRDRGPDSAPDRGPDRGVVTKPFRRVDLLAKVRAILDAAED